MSIYKHLQDIPFSHEKALIVNVHTLLSTTLALASASRYLQVPLVVIDCPWQGQSDWESLCRLQTKYDFDLVSCPLRTHGDTLDDAFLHLQTDWLYLVDSDVELLNDTGIQAMRAMRDHNLLPADQVFGVGLQQVSGFGLPPMERVFHAERMWVPFCCLSAEKVRREIKCHTSFNIASQANYGRMGGGILRVRRKLLKMGCRYLARWVDEVLNLFRYQYKKQHIDSTLYDTGALIYEQLRKQGLHYLGLSFYSYPAFVVHYCGITRSQMYENEPVATQMQDIEQTIRHTLLNKYDFDYDRFYGIE